MPFEKLSLAAMTATSDEYVCTEGIAERFDVSKRTIERLIERFAKKLRKSRRRRGRTIEYLWSDVLQCAKTYTGIIEKENVPSVAIKKAYTKQRVKELEAEVERLKKEIENS